MVFLVIKRNCKITFTSYLIPIFTCITDPPPTTNIIYIYADGYEQLEIIVYDLLDLMNFELKTKTTS